MLVPQAVWLTNITSSTPPPPTTTMTRLSCVLAIVAAVAVLAPSVALAQNQYTCSNTLVSVGELSSCGNFAYHPSEHVCCNGVLNERTGGNNQCCGTEWGLVSRCCNGVLTDPTNGTACCNGNIYNPDFFVCCEDGSVLPTTFSSFTFPACCYDASSKTTSLYDAATSTCCGGTVRDQVSAPDQAICCIDGQYEEFNALVENRACCETRSRSEIFDANTHRCCEDGPVVLPDTINTYQCCGAELYDVDEQDCCDGVLYDKQDDYMCCGTQYSDVSALDFPTCCGSTLYDAGVGALRCCAEGVYNLNDDTCVQQECRRCGEREFCAASTSSATGPLATVLAVAAALILALTV
ncbi:hypothetical protein PTSG_01340 [Salpingoeca rosetta]|uniref:Galaxin-like repeats domain-containing protein n=1 Tax=Salpingoeca rosetta (strain ATCC 50818 / BSB-021) TaxID=946362 RepID=F2U024_SALR5|nr:uncharacterized protein PTSG_01340 [Salpingoeca rosetta]EGD80752.1 hypothetical protein PTSG_01340 [Salpingoeca rosetta]|eukprot:XP_004997313.1 hypothetical protein PTSG_01340 [Salpingoeca rosetta]